MLQTANYNCYEYLVENTKIFTDIYTVEYFGKKLRKSEFLSQIDKMAGYLKNNLGLRRGDVFTVFLPTTVQSFIAFYSLLKIGVIANFVHPLSPPEVLTQLMSEAGSKGLFILDLLAEKYVDAINSMNVTCIVCSVSDYSAPVRKCGLTVLKTGLKIFKSPIKKRVDFSSALRQGKPCAGEVNNGGDIAVYLNGGGTTGKSKTIKLTNKAINELAYKVGLISSSEEPGKDCSTLVLPLFHAFGLCVGMHTVACNGVRIIPMMNFNPKRFNAIMHRRKIMFAVGIPVMYKKLMQEKNFEGKHLKNLRLMFCGGDAVSETALNEFNSVLEKYGAPGRLMRGYGLTEVVAVCCTNTTENCRADSIGKPLEGITMQIWDEERNELPNGIIGEICISGSTVMEGYYTLDKPADEGVYTDENGVKWIQSGDLGYKDDDGYIFFSGRKKRLIIISGYNVFPGDVEKVVEELDFVREVCAVQGYVDAKPIVRLFISLTEKRDENEVKAKITQLCSEKLSQFSVPKEIIIMDELPRTRMKKIDFMTLTEQLPKAN